MPRSSFRRPPTRPTQPAPRVPPSSTPLGAPEREVLEQLNALGTGYHELAWSTALRDLTYAGLVEEWRVPEVPRAAPWRRSTAPQPTPPRSYRLTERGREALDDVRRREDAERVAGGVESW